MSFKFFLNSGPYFKLGLLLFLTKSQNKFDQIIPFFKMENIMQQWLKIHSIIVQSFCKISNQ